MNIFTKYGFAGTLYLIVCTIRTRLFYPKARLIRFPIDIRGKKFISLGAGFTTGRGCRIEALPEVPGTTTCIKIGTNVQINDYVHITGLKAVEIGNNVLIASKVYISDVSHGNYNGEELQADPGSIPADRLLIHKPIKIGNNVWIGEGVCILPGVTIGNGSIIGANAVVNKDIPSNSIVGGVPAKVLKVYNDQTLKWERIK